MGFTPSVAVLFCLASIPVARAEEAPWRGESRPPAQAGEPASPGARLVGEGLSPEATYVFDESATKSRALAVALEFFVPGLGSVYADHAIGAVVTWLSMLGGVVLFAKGIVADDHSVDATTARGRYDERVADWQIGGGLVLLLFGRTFGFVDSWTAVQDHNDRLYERLFAEPRISFRVAPLQTRVGAALAPAVRLVF